MTIRYIEDRLIEVDVPQISDVIKPYENQVINQWKEELPNFPYMYLDENSNLKDPFSNQTNALDIRCKIEPLNNILFEVFYNSIHYIFDIDEPDEMGNFVYIQNNERSAQVLHQHIWGNRGKTSVCGTMYLNVPDNGGEFMYYVGRGFKKLKVQENKLYLFPNWLFHSTCQQDDWKHRICFNLEYSSNLKAFDKKYRVYW